MEKYPLIGRKKFHYHNIIRVYDMYKVDPYGEDTIELVRLNNLLREKKDEWESELDKLDSLNPFDLPEDTSKEKKELRDKIAVALSILLQIKPE